MGDREKGAGRVKNEKIAAVRMVLKNHGNLVLISKRRRTSNSPDETSGDNISNLNPFPHWSAHTQLCKVIVV